MCTFVYVPTSSGPLQGQRYWILWSWSYWQYSVWVLGIEFWSFARVSYVLNQ